MHKFLNNTGNKSENAEAKITVPQKTQRSFYEKEYLEKIEKAKKQVEYYIKSGLDEIDILPEKGFDLLNQMLARVISEATQNPSKPLFFIIYEIRSDKKFQERCSEFRTILETTFGTEYIVDILAFPITTLKNLYIQAIKNTLENDINTTLSSPDYKKDHPDRLSAFQVDSMQWTVLYDDLIKCTDVRSILRMISTLPSEAAYGKGGAYKNIFFATVKELTEDFVVRKAPAVTPQPAAAAAPKRPSSP